MRKGSKVKKVLDGKTNLLKLKGFIMLEDSWISRYDTPLYNQNNERFDVLDFYTLEEEKPHKYPWFKRLKSSTTQYSCVLLNKPVNVGDILYTSQLN